MKNICTVCSKNKSKRFCKIKNNTMICSLCCVGIRNDECEGCSYYEDAKRYNDTKEHQKQESPHFIARMDTEVDEQVNKALELAESGQFLEGNKILSKLLIYNSDIASVHFGLGVICVMQKKIDEALLHFDKATDIYPYDTDSWFNKAVLYKETLNIEKALEAFQKVAEFGNSMDENVIQAKEILLITSKELNDKNGITIDEFLNAGRIFKAGFDYIEKSQWQKAIDKFQEVIRINHHHPQSYGNMALCYANIGDKQKALAALDMALELDPSYKPALINKKIIATMSEGEPLGVLPIMSVEYYKDIAKQKNI